MSIQKRDAMKKHAKQAHEEKVKKTTFRSRQAQHVGAAVTRTQRSAAKVQGAEPATKPKERHGTAIEVRAKYTKPNVPGWDGNPFIEALPPIKEFKSEFLTLLENLPSPPTARTRRKPEVPRIMEMMSLLKTVVVSFPEHEDIGIALEFIIRESYKARNPLTKMDRQRRHAIAMGGADGVELPSNWNPSGEGYVLFAVTGMGKTTSFRNYLQRYPQVIRHTKYEGNALKCRQLVYIILRVPHDATLKSFCLAFFKEIDRLLGTNYQKEAKALRQIALMKDLMNQVATAVSLGLVVVDDVHKLRHATGENAIYALNLLGDIVEEMGISLLTVSTPAVASVMEASVSNHRKIGSQGGELIAPMRGEQFRDFCKDFWPYMYVRNKTELTTPIIRAWFLASAGNTAFAVAAFMLAQKYEIGGRELIDENSFNVVANTKMAFLQPAIHALLSGKPDRLKEFEDLIFSDKFVALCRMLEVDLKEEKAQTTEEFDDVPAADEKAGKGNKSRPKKTKQTKASKSKNAGASNPNSRIHRAKNMRVEQSDDVDLPMEDPLAKF